MSTAVPVTVTQVRVLEGPNLYFPRPAVKIIVSCPGYLSAQDAALRAVSRALGTREVRPGAPDSEQRQRAVMALVAQVVHRVAADSGTTRLGVRVRTGGSRDEVVVAFPWRWRGRGLALGECLESALTGLLDPDEVVRSLSDRTDVLVEGGPTLAGAFLRAGVIDRILAYVAPILLGGPIAAVDDVGVPSIARALRWRYDGVESLGPDVLLSLVPD